MKTPHSGSSYVFLRAQKFHPTIVATYVTDLMQILKPHIELHDTLSFILLSDEGPDFTPNSVLSSIYFFCLFKELNLDLLSVSIYAARYSAFNPIEHLWSTLSNKLAGVVLLSKLGGECQPRSQQSGLSKETVPQKEKVLSNKAIENVLTHWKNKKFDDFDVNTSAIPCAEAKNRWDYYERVKAFLDSPLNSIHKYIHISKEYQSIFKHIHRCANETVFTKCTDREYCSEGLCKDLFAFLSRYNMKLFAPTKSEKHVGLFNSFLQAYTSNNNEFVSSGQQSVEKKNLGKCGHCPEYQKRRDTFQSSIVVEKRLHQTTKVTIVMFVEKSLTVFQHRIDTN